MQARKEKDLALGCIFFFVQYEVQATELGLKNRIIRKEFFGRVGAVMQEVY